jgi:hypothetical protein
MITHVRLASHLLAAALAAAGAGSAHAQDPAQKGLEIARKADQAGQGFVGEKGTMTLELINAHGDVTKRKMAMELLEVAADGDKSKTVFEWPADVKGTKLLTWTHKKGDDDQWLYMPAVKRIKRISGSNKTGAFMGSEFSYEDLSSVEIEKYTYKYIDEPKLGGRDTWRIERYPVDKNSGYRRQIVWLDKEYLSPLKIEYYDRKNELLKVATFDGYKLHGRFWRFRTIRVENVQTRKKSVITWENRQIGVKLPPESFDSARLED